MLPILNHDIKKSSFFKAGFTNAVNFSDNFQRKFEIKPSYFIKMMKENIKTHFKKYLNKKTSTFS